MNNEQPTPVIFRRWKWNGLTGRERNYGDLIALFPTIPFDNDGRLCQSYEHVGQHGGADYGLVMRLTQPLYADLPRDVEEARELEDELVARGYVLQRCTRRTAAHRRAYDDALHNSKMLAFAMADAAEREKEA